LEGRKVKDLNPTGKTCLVPRGSDEVVLAWGEPDPRDSILWRLMKGVFFILHLNAWSGDAEGTGKEVDKDPRAAGVCGEP
jgi:hypothetical protein